MLINGRPAGRIGEKVGCSALSVGPTSPDVLIGGPSAADPDVVVSPEVPDWAVTGLQVLGVAGAVMALPFAIATVGVAATIGGGVGGYVGGDLATKGARALGKHMGLSESKIRAMEVGGGFLGSLAGGGLAARGTQAFNKRDQISVEPNTLGSNGGNIRITRRGPKIEPGKDFTAAQKREILAANREKNDGELRSDKSGDVLVPSAKSQKGVTPPQNEVQVDHRTPKAQGGSNNPNNADVLSRKENRDKWDK